MPNQPYLLQPDADRPHDQPVTCLGLTFPNDAARRAHFTDLLRRKLQDPAFRRIEGFPQGSDDAILAMSDPPYYTACPNPFIDDFIRVHGTPYDPAADTYQREPFAVDVSVGKTDALYRAHSYHTKVPHLAIVPSILHYTAPGDIVLDGFCGSGMTGVAAQWCGSAPEDYRHALELEWQQQGRDKPQWGPRRAVLNDLSPAATFIAANYNLPFDVNAFTAAGRQLLDDVEAELGWMYTTLHADGVTQGRIEYTVWSEVYTCPQCAGEVVFLEEALNRETGRVRDTFPCPHCGADLDKSNLDRKFTVETDPVLRTPWRHITLRPVLICYVVDGQRYEKTPDTADLDVLAKIADMPYPHDMPTARFPVESMYHGSRIEPKGFTHLHHFFLPRAAHALTAMWRHAHAQPDPRIRHMLLFFVEQAIWSMSVMNRYRPTGFSQVNQFLSGVYYVASQISETNPEYVLAGKLRRLESTLEAFEPKDGATICMTGTLANLPLQQDSIDYIFTDPPFGENIYYADLNYLVESWHGVVTNAQPEAIIDRFKGKELADYQHLMQRCFHEYHRVLKPGRWLTVVFHNSRNAVWNAIQEAILAAGFVVADVRTLDKQQGSYRQVTSSAVKQDLVISAYKPAHQLETRFSTAAGSADGVWDFVRNHLRQLPVFIAKDGAVEVIAERQDYLLFDRMVAFHVQRGVTVPLATAEFYAGLEQRFPRRDGMYFLPDQAAAYDKQRYKVTMVEQYVLAVTDEASAIQWLRQQLTAKPQTRQDLNPLFMRELGGWQKHEKPLELVDLLEENFLYYDGVGPVPSQVHSYLSTNYKDLRNLDKDDPDLRAKAKERWYVPDPNKAADLEKLRERALLREFQEYRDSKQKRLKVFRLEAVRAGFKKAWQERDYAAIVDVAAKIPAPILQEDPKLIMWYDVAVTRHQT